MKLKNNIISPPILRISDEENKERHADWLELFFDLIFVAAISQLALNLSSDYSFINFLESIPLFFVIWWGWVGHTFYLSRFGTDDILHRILTMLQMLTVAALAANVQGALTISGASFAISYAILRLLLVAEYYRAGIHIEQARTLTNHYVKGFGVAAIIWAISAFFPDPARYLLWALALIIDLLTPITASQKQVKLPPHSTHLPERFGLFTIILIGEAVVSIVFRVSDLGLTFITETTAIMGFIIVFTIWWGYFDESKGASARVQEAGNQIGKYQLWLYSHFPLLLGIVTLAAGIKHVISLDVWYLLPPMEAWLLCSALALTLLSLSLIFLSSFDYNECISTYLLKLRLPYYIIIILVLLTGFLGSILPGSIILAILTALCIIKILISLIKPPKATCKI